MASPSKGDPGGEGGSTQSSSPGEGSAGDTVTGRIIGGNFRVLKLLGAGAMGHVYQAEQLSLGKVVAVKLLRQELMGDETLIRRFELEAKNASLLNHPNSIQIIDFGRDGGLLYIAMEYLSGLDLGQLILREGPLPLRRIGRIMDQVLAALDEAHAMGLVHRDLKPGNIMLVPRRDEPDFVKVCDFGIAKAQTPGAGDGLTLKGLVCGTPEYMSPEQVRGQDVDGRSDLYALGVLLYQLLTGELPFTAASPVEILSKQLGEAPTPPSVRRPDLGVPAGLEALVLCALAKDPLGRPQSARRMRRELGQAVGEAGGWNPRPSSASGLGQRAPETSGLPTTPITIGRAGERAAPESGFLPPTATSSQASREARAIRPRRSAVVGGALLLGAVVGLFWLSRENGPASPQIEPVLPGKSAPVAAAHPPAEIPEMAEIAGGDGDGDDGALERLRPDGAGKRNKRTRAGIKRAGVRARADFRSRATANDVETVDHAVAGETAAPGPEGPLDEPLEAPPAPNRPPSPPTPDAASLMAEARALLGTGDIAAACAKGEEGKALSPEEAGIHRFLGKCYMRAGNPDKAKENYRRYLELYPQAPDAAFIRSIVR